MLLLTCLNGIMMMVTSVEFKVIEEWSKKNGEAESDSESESERLRGKSDEEESKPQLEQEYLQSTRIHNTHRA